MDSSSFCALGFVLGALPFLLLWRAERDNARKNRTAIRGYVRSRNVLLEQDRDNRRKYHVK